MSIHPISCSDFESFKVSVCFRARKTDHETAWYADASGHTLGVIYFDSESGFWACDASERLRNGRYRRIALAVDLKNAKSAEMRLVTAMERQVAQRTAAAADRRM
jgi:hypothetical protein